MDHMALSTDFYIVHSHWTHCIAKPDFSYGYKHGHNHLSIQLFQLTMSDKSLKPMWQDQMVVWVEVEGCCTWLYFVGFFFLFRHLWKQSFLCHSELKRYLANKTMQQWKKNYGKMTAEIKHIYSKLMQDPNTKIKTCSFHLHRYANSSEYPDHRPVLSCRLDAFSDNVYWNSCR